MQRQIGDQRQVIGRLPRQCGPRWVRCPLDVEIATYEQGVERSDREGRGEGVRARTCTAEAFRSEQAVPQSPPDIIEVPPDDDGRPLVKALERGRREEALELRLPLGAYEP